MKNLIFILLLLPLFVSAQSVKIYTPFAAGNDTIFTTSSDSVDIQLGINGLNMGNWEPLTQVLAANDTVYITLDDKTSDRTKTYLLPSESFWTRFESCRLRIRAEDDTLNSNYISLGGTADGSATLFVQPVSYGDATVDTILYKVRFISK